MHRLRVALRPILFSGLVSHARSLSGYDLSPSKKSSLTLLARHAAQGQSALAPSSWTPLTDMTVDETSLQRPDCNYSPEDSDCNYSAEGYMVLELSLRPWTECDMDRRSRQDFEDNPC